jgi:hypothetical protein
MRQGIVLAVVVAVVMLAGAPVSWASLTPILQSDFLPGSQVVTFEAGSTGLPSVPGLTFLQTGQYGSSGNFNGFFGSQGWSNTVGPTYDDLGAQFSPTVQAVGGYVGRIPNFKNQHPSKVVVELFNSSLISLGTASIDVPPAFNSPVFFGVRADEPIARFRMTSNNAGFFSVDNFTFGSTVPEPASSTSAIVGIGALLIRRGRRGGSRRALGAHLASARTLRR